MNITLCRHNIYFHWLSCYNVAYGTLRDQKPILAGYAHLRKGIFLWAFAGANRGLRLDNRTNINLAVFLLCNVVVVCILLVA